MALTTNDINYAKKIVENLNKTFKDKGLGEAFKLVEKEVDGNMCHFFEFYFPAFGVKQLTPVKLYKNETE